DSANSGVIESKSANPAATKEDAVDLPVTKKKSKKKKKAPKGKKTVNRPVAAPKANKVKPPPSTDFTISFARKLTSAEKRKKKKSKKTKNIRLIDFSSQPSRDDLAFMETLSDKEINKKIKPHHVFALMTANISDHTALNTCLAELEGFIHKILLASPLLRDDFSKFAMMQSSYYKSHNLTLTLASAIMVDDYGVNTLLVHMTEFTLQLCANDPHIRKDVVDSLIERDDLAARSIGLLAMSNGRSFSNVIDFFAEDPLIIPLIVNILNSNVGETFNRKDLSTITIGGVEKLATIAQRVLFYNDTKGAALKLIELAHTIPSMLDVVLLALNEPFPGDKICLFSHVAIKSPSILEAIIDLATINDAALDSLVYAMRLPNIKSDERLIIGIVKSNPTCLMKLTALAEKNDRLGNDMREVIAESLIDDSSNFYLLLMNNSPVLEPLLQVAIHHPEFCTSLLGGLKAQYDGGPPESYETKYSYLTRWIDTPKLFDQEYPVLRHHLEHSEGCASDFITLAFYTEPHTREGAIATEGNFFNYMALKHPNEFIDLIQLAIKKETGFELLFSSLDIKNGDGYVPLAVLRLTDAAKDKIDDIGAQLAARAPHAPSVSQHAKSVGLFADKVATEAPHPGDSSTAEGPAARII
ncbi:MAG: hypothetical protein P1U34_09790, partial [Coxiellaceae bacterium]|nr:hypothetical protein [Coxiellaceae bacterium]